MVSRRSLRLSLLALLGFMVFCLVVMEVALHRKQWVRFYHKLSPSYLERALDTTSSSSSLEALRISSLAENVTVASLPGDQSKKAGSLSTNPRATKSSSSSAAAAAAGEEGRTRGGSPLRVSSSTGVRGNSVENVTGVLPPSTPAPPPSPPPPTSSSLKTTPSSSSTDHCQGTGAAAPSESGAFSLGAQKLPDGSRPQNCSHCFHSDFPVLLQSCRVCNSVAGSGEKKGENSPGGAVEVVMVILTTHGAVDKRRAIRHTWASVTRNNSETAHVRHVFVLGRSKNEADMQLVRQEHETWGDIIMYDFVDTYANLTLKTLTCLHWVLTYCHNARFMLKADDDMWINVPTLLTTVRRETATLHTAIGGACRTSAGPIRNRHSKWYASEKDYPQDSYPGFCSGTSYVTSLNVVRHVLSVSPDVPFFYLEDVYMALCIKKLGPPFRLQGLRGFFHGWASPCVLKGPGAVSVHEVDPQKLVSIWEAKCP